MANYAHPELVPTHPQHCILWSVDDIQWLAHWMASDGNATDTACVATYMAELNTKGKEVLARCLSLQAKYSVPFRPSLP